MIALLRLRPLFLLHPCGDAILVSAKLKIQVVRIAEMADSSNTHQFQNFIFVLTTFLDQFSDSFVQSDDILVDFLPFKVMDSGGGHKFDFRFLKTDATRRHSSSLGHYFAVCIFFNFRHICRIRNYTKLIYSI